MKTAGKTLKKKKVGTLIEDTEDAPQNKEYRMYREESNCPPQP